jgi:hypothetical protein
MQCKGLKWMRSSITNYQIALTTHLFVTVAVVIPPLACGNHYGPCARYSGQSIAEALVDIPFQFLRLAFPDFEVPDRSIEYAAASTPLIMLLNSMTILLILRSIAVSAKAITRRLFPALYISPIHPPDKADALLKRGASAVKLSLWSPVVPVLLFIQFYILSVYLFSVAYFAWYGGGDYWSAPRYLLVLIIPCVTSYALRTRSRFRPQHRQFWESWNRISWYVGLLIVAVRYLLPLLAPNNYKA